MAEKSSILLISLLVVIMGVSGIYLFVKHQGKSKQNNNPNYIINKKMKFNVTVSQIRGDGNFTTISEAILAAPSHNSDRFFIRVNSGVYNEVVVVPENKTNIVLVGDGADITKITATRHVPDFSTSETATFSILGDGFMAQDITFENNAGSESGQAVAVLCSANYTVFYKCKFLGYHDTLYAKEGRQFYRECDIYGTVDFIFGFAAAVFQRCNLYARFPDYQIITYTAQGRQSLDQLSGFTLQGCNVTTSAEMVTRNEMISGYLGRPWFPYSTVMVMESYLDSIVDPSGWEGWPSTPVTNAIYLEFNNRGPGADTSRRVNWTGFKVIDDDTRDAMPYTASKLIQGDDWIPKTGVPYDSGFLSIS